MTTAPPGVYRIGISSDAKCATAKYCFPIGGIERTQTKWLAEHDLFVSKDRVFALVDTSREVFFMDAITGTLYQFGECLTSTNLNYNSFIRDHRKAAKILRIRTESLKSGKSDLDAETEVPDDQDADN